MFFWGFHIYIEYYGVEFTFKFLIFECVFQILLQFMWNSIFCEGGWGGEGGGGRSWGTGSHDLCVMWITISKYLVQNCFLIFLKTIWNICAGCPFQIRDFEIILFCFSDISSFSYMFSVIFMIILFISYMCFPKWFHDLCILGLFNI